MFPNLPFYNDTQSANTFTSILRILASPDHPIEVPKRVDEKLLFSIDLGLLPCLGQTCEHPNGTQFAASINNISFVSPIVSILQAYYFGIKDVFSTGFPSKPPIQFNYTRQNILTNFLAPMQGTRVNNK